MRVVDAAWIGIKLRKLLSLAEPLGHCLAFVLRPPPGQRRQQTRPSTVACPAQLAIHRYTMLGLLDGRGFPLRDMGVPKAPGDGATAAPLQAGRPGGRARSAATPA